MPAGRSTFHVIFCCFDSISNYLQMFVNFTLQNVNIIRLTYNLCMEGFRILLQSRKNYCELQCCIQRYTILGPSQKRIVDVTSSRSRGSFSVRAYA